MFTAINGVTVLETIPETECDFIKCTIIVAICAVFISAGFVVYGWCKIHSVTDDGDGERWMRPAGDVCTSEKSRRTQTGLSA